MTAGVEQLFLAIAASRRFCTLLEDLSKDICGHTGKKKKSTGRRKGGNMNTVVDRDRNEISSRFFWKYGQKYRRLNTGDTD